MHQGEVMRPICVDSSHGWSYLSARLVCLLVTLLCHFQQLSCKVVSLVISLLSLGVSPLTPVTQRRIHDVG